MRKRWMLWGLSITVAFAVSAQDSAAPAATAVPAAEPAPAAVEPVPTAGEAAAAAAAASAPAKPGDPVAGQGKIAVCAACHGMDGNSVIPANPKLAGQHERYIHRQLQLFKSGERNNAIMLGFAMTLSEQDMRDIGAWYASQSAQSGIANDAKISDASDETWAQRGERLYRGGDKVSGTPACMACHGPAGEGNPGAAYPHLAGQHADYTKAKLLAFRDGEVWGKGDNANAVMAGVAKYLSDEDIEALATYIEGLHRRPAAEAGTVTAAR
jgi:cytochrome c553